MKTAIAVVVFAISVIGCGGSGPHGVPPTSDPKLDEYFSEYCGYTGNMGIGFVASHTYEYKFRKRLASTNDPELKRLFVLYNLYGDVERAISNLEEGKVWIGKNLSQEMTPEERDAASSKIFQRLKDLAQFDPGDPEGAIRSFEGRLKELNTQS